MSDTEAKQTENSGDSAEEELEYSDEHSEEISVDSGEDGKGPEIEETKEPEEADEEKEKEPEKEKAEPEGERQKVSEKSTESSGGLTDSHEESNGENIEGKDGDVKDGDVKEENRKTAEETVVEKEPGNEKEKKVNPGSSKSVEGKIKVHTESKALKRRKGPRWCKTHQRYHGRKCIRGPRGKVGPVGPAGERGPRGKDADVSSLRYSHLLYQQNFFDPASQNRYFSQKEEITNFAYIPFESREENVYSLDQISCVVDASFETEGMKYTLYLSIDDDRVTSIAEISIDSSTGGVEYISSKEEINSFDSISSETRKVFRVWGKFSSEPREGDKISLYHISVRTFSNVIA